LIFTFGFISRAADLQFLARHPHFTHGHLILSQGSAFIGANHRDIAQRFDNAQPFTTTRRASSGVETALASESVSVTGSPSGVIATMIPNANNIGLMLMCCFMVGS